MGRFDPDVVHQCALECLGKPKPQMFDAFANALAAHYPNTLDFSQPWVYSIAGGAMIQMKLYYASTSEYIMIWELRSVPRAIPAVILPDSGILLSMEKPVLCRGSIRENCL